MSDSRLQEYYEEQNTLRVLAKASYEQYMLAQFAYDQHTMRLTTLYCGSGTKMYLDGTDISEGD